MAVDTTPTDVATPLKPAFAIDCILFNPFSKPALSNKVSITTLPSAQIFEYLNIVYSFLLLSTTKH
jgi:hypothetical protein